MWAGIVVTLFVVRARVVTCGYGDVGRGCAYALRGLCTCGHVRIRRCGQGLRLRSSWFVHVWSCADRAMWARVEVTLFVVCARVIMCGYGDVGRGYAYALRGLCTCGHVRIRRCGQGLRLRSSWVCARVVMCGYGDVGRGCGYALRGLCTCGHVRIRRCGQGLWLRSSWFVHVWSCADTAMWAGVALTLFVVCARVVMCFVHVCSCGGYGDVGQRLRLRSSWFVHVCSCADTAMWAGVAVTLFVVCARVVMCGYGDAGRGCGYGLRGLCTCGHVRIRRCGQGLRLRSSWFVHVWSCADTAMWAGIAVTLFVVCARVVICGYGDVGRGCACALRGLCTCVHLRIRRCGQGLRLRSSWFVHVYSCAATAMWAGVAVTLFVVCARVVMCGYGDVGRGCACALRGLCTCVHLRIRRCGQGLRSRRF